MSAFDELVEDEHEPCALLMAGSLRALSGENSLWFSMRYPFLLEVRDLGGRESEKDNKAKMQLRPTLRFADRAETIETVMRAAEGCSVTQPS